MERRHPVFKWPSSLSTARVAFAGPARITALMTFDWVTRVDACMRVVPIQLSALFTICCQSASPCHRPTGYVLRVFPPLHLALPILSSPLTAFHCPCTPLPTILSPSPKGSKYSVLQIAVDQYVVCTSSVLQKSPIGTSKIFLCRAPCLPSTISSMKVQCQDS